MHRSRFASCLVMLALASLPWLAGCGPKLAAVSMNGEDPPAEAMPYFLPRPYLLITRNYTSTKTTKVVTKEKGKDGTTKETRTETTEPAKAAGDESVFAYQIVYLPDPSEKYGLRIVRGLGTFHGKIALADGWRFTGTEVKTDSKVPETIEAAGEAVGEVADLVEVLGLDSSVRTFSVREKPGARVIDAEIALYDLFSGRCVLSLPRVPECQ